MKTIYEHKANTPKNIESLLYSFVISPSEATAKDIPCKATQETYEIAKIICTLTTNKLK